MSDDNRKDTDELKPDSTNQGDETLPRSPSKRVIGEIDTDDSDLVQKTTVLSRNNPILKRALSHQQSGDDGEDEGEELGEKREVLLLIRGMGERVVMREGVTYKLGRYDLGAQSPDEVDLIPYGAMDRGVSRIHATMHIEDGVLYITDNGSTNGTYLGGKQLDPHEPTAVKKGDELLLGRLAVQIMFR